MQRVSGDNQGGSARVARWFLDDQQSVRIVGGRPEPLLPDIKAQHNRFSVCGLRAMNVLFRAISEPSPISRNNELY